MRFTIHENGSFDLWGTRVSLTGAYPAVDGAALHPTAVVAAADSVLYRVPGGELRLSFAAAENGALALRCACSGLAGVHDIEPVGGAVISGAAAAYVQGFGMEGPSGCFSLDADAPSSYGLTALYADPQAETLLAWAEDHRRYTALFRTEGRKTIRGGQSVLSCGFNLEGTAGKEATLPPLYFTDAPDLSGGLEACARRIAKEMGARKAMPPAFFWSSWYHAYETMDQALLEETLAGIKNENLPFQYIEIDAGYTPALGDWLTPNHRWPGGLAQAARTILNAGCRPGIWIGPFIVGNLSKLYREHPDWILKNPDGTPFVQLRSYTEPKIWGCRDGEYYVLDCSNPAALAYLETVFRTLKGWGFSFFKTDFMLWNMQDSAAVRRYDPTLTSVEVMRRVLETIRGAIGEDSYLLGCIAPFMPFIGYADGMRIAGDCGARWAEPYGPVNLLRELPCDGYFNHIFWQNDPDAMLPRDFDTMLTPEEAQSLVLLQALSGGAVSTSDPVHRLSEDRKALLRFVIPHGQRTPEAPCLGTGRKEITLLHRLEQGKLLFVLNPTDEPLAVLYRMQELFGPGDWYQYRFDLESDSAVSVREDVFAETLPAHGCALVFVTDAPLVKKPENLWVW